MHTSTQASGVNTQLRTWWNGHRCFVYFWRKQIENFKSCGLWELQAAALPILIIDMARLNAHQVRMGRTRKGVPRVSIGSCDEGAVDRRSDEHKRKIIRAPNAEQRGEKDTKVAWFFFIFHGNRSSGVVVCGRRTKVEIVLFPRIRGHLNIYILAGDARTARHWNL